MVNSIARLPDPLLERQLLSASTAYVEALLQDPDCDLDALFDEEVQREQRKLAAQCRIDRETAIELAELERSIRNEEGSGLKKPEVTDTPG